MPVSKNYLSECDVKSRKAFYYTVVTSDRITLKTPSLYPPIPAT